MILLATIYFVDMSRQMGIDKANVRLVDLHADTNTALVALGGGRRLSEFDVSLSVSDENFYKP